MQCMKATSFADHQCATSHLWVCSHQSGLQRQQEQSHIPLSAHQHGLRCTLLLTSSSQSGCLEGITQLAAITCHLYKHALQVTMAIHYNEATS